MTPSGSCRRSGSGFPEKVSEPKKRAESTKVDSALADGSSEKIAFFAVTIPGARLRNAVLRVLSHRLRLLLEPGSLQLRNGNPADAGSVLRYEIGIAVPNCPNNARVGSAITGRPVDNPRSRLDILGRSRAGGDSRILDLPGQCAGFQRERCACLPGAKPVQGRNGGSGSIPVALADNSHDGTASPTRIPACPSQFGQFFCNDVDFCLVHEDPPPKIFRRATSCGALEVRLPVY